MDKPLITAAVLSYNTGLWVTKSLKALMENGYENLEIYCIDDASTDNNSVDHLKKFVALNPQIHLEINNKNLGITKNLNKVLAKAKGKYFLFLADDFMVPGKLQADVNVLEVSDEKVAVVHSIMQNTNHDGTINFPSFSPTYPYPQLEPDLSDLGKVILSGGGVAAPTALFKTKILKEISGWDESLRYEDKPMFMRLSFLGFKSIFRPEVTMRYRRNHLQVSNQFKDGDLIYQSLVYSKYSFQKEARREMRRIIIIAASAKNNGVKDLSECIRIYRQSTKQPSLVVFLARSGLVSLAAKLLKQVKKLNNRTIK